MMKETIKPFFHDRSVNGKTHDILSNITHLEALGGIFHLMKHLQKKKWSSFICKHFKPDSFKNRKAIFYCLGSFKRTRENHYPLQLRSLREVTKSPYDKVDKRRKDVRIDQILRNMLEEAWIAIISL